MSIGVHRGPFFVVQTNELKITIINCQKRDEVEAVIITQQGIS